MKLKHALLGDPAFVEITAGVLRFAETLSEGLRALLLLTGARRPENLVEVPRVIGPALAAWLGQGTDQIHPIGQG